MTRLLIVFLALMLASRAPAESFLAKGSGAAGAAVLAASLLGMSVLSQSQETSSSGKDVVWRPRGTYTAPTLTPICPYNSGMAVLAAALKDEAPLEDQIPLRKSQILVTDPKRPNDGPIYDPKQIYSAGRPSICREEVAP